MEEEKLEDFFEEQDDNHEVQEAYSGTAFVLKLIGGLNIIVGVLAGLIIVTTKESNLMLGISVIVAGTVSGVLFFAFSKIITLLQKIACLLEQMKNR